MNIKDDRNIVPTGSFCFSDFRWCQKNAHKKTADEIPAEGNCQRFLKGRQYERLGWKEGQQFFATKMNFEKLPAGGGARGWIRKCPGSARICFHFWPRNWGKGGEVVKVGILLPLLLILKINLSATKMNFEKPPAGGGERYWIRNIPELARLHFHCRPRNRGKVGEVGIVLPLLLFF